jgi:hypothetical protein
MGKQERIAAWQPLVISLIPGMLLSFPIGHCDALPTAGGFEWFAKSSFYITAWS